MFFANLTISGRIGSIEKTSISGKKTLSRPKKRFHDTFFHKSRHTPPYFFQSGTRFRPKKTKNRLLNIPPLPFFFRSKVRCRSRSIWKKISKTTFLTFFLGSIGNPFFQKSRGQKFKKMTWPPFRFFDQTPKTSNFGNSVFSGPDPFFWQFEVFDQIPEILEIRIPKTRSQNSEFQSRIWEIPKSQNRIPKTRFRQSGHDSNFWHVRQNLELNSKKTSLTVRFFEIANTNLQNLESEFRFFRFSSIFFGIPIQKINALPTKLTFFQ